LKEKQAVVVCDHIKQAVRRQLSWGKSKRSEGKAWSGPSVTLAFHEQKNAMQLWRLIEQTNEVESARSGKRLFRVFECV
jgi:hypothetical protein